MESDGDIESGGDIESDGDMESGAIVSDGAIISLVGLISPDVGASLSSPSPQAVRNASAAAAANTPPATGRRALDRTGLVFDMV
ncbi:hypothetical protein [Gordonia zhaorongruii]|uniref:hypothetical protein n=1 Tax=Gordonia zhaorongruii TaxID=2597659 RepID=UPI00117D81D6|nr:hypothetical protein [Gordonia zhaorongruii]